MAAAAIVGASFDGSSRSSFISLSSNTTEGDGLGEALKSGESIVEERVKAAVDCWGSSGRFGAESVMMKAKRGSGARAGLATASTEITLAEGTAQGSSGWSRHTDEASHGSDAQKPRASPREAEKQQPAKKGEKGVPMLEQKATNKGPVTRREGPKGKTKNRREEDQERAAVDDARKHVDEFANHDPEVKESGWRGRETRAPGGRVIQGEMGLEFGILTSRAIGGAWRRRRGVASGAVGRGPTATLVTPMPLLAIDLFGLRLAR